MEKIIHPISGEKGFFTSVREKELIDVVMLMLLVGQTKSSCSVECGVKHE